MGKTPVFLGLLLAGLMLPGCEWGGKHQGMASNRPAAPVYTSGTPPTNSGQNNWNNGRSPSANASPFPNPNRGGNVSYNSNGSDVPGGFNTPSSTAANRSTAPYTNEYDTPATTSRRPTDSAVFQAGGSAPSTVRPPVGGAGRVGLPAMNPPSAPEPFEGNESAPVLSRPPAAPDYRP